MSKKKKTIETPEKEERVEESKDYLEHLQRLQAEFENFQKRVAKEKEQLLQFANKGLLLKLLEVNDNFERALKAESEIKEGVEMIFKQFNDLLEKEGVSQIKAKGKDFDPRLHEAVTKEGEGNKIVEVFQKGYMFKDKLLRPSKVKIGGNKNG